MDGVPDILTPEQAAEYLQLSVETVKRKARSGVLPAARIGREWRFSRRRLLEWVEEDGEIPEELVDQALIAICEERAGRARDEDLIPLDEVKRSLGL
jgi:excisionase family DNA binding protein